MRFLFEITYDGANYHGWQSQLNALGVQQVVEEALSKLLRVKVSIVGSGRTDTGVHCVQQFFHTDIEKPFHPENLILRLNSLLGRDIAIRSIRQIRSEASARYDAVRRTYEYHITRVKDPLLNGRAFYFYKPLDLSTLRRASSFLSGTHDFETFSKVKTDVGHFICKVTEAKWNQKGDLLVFTISANRFLRGMVRAIVGTLLDTGTGKLTLDDFKVVMRSKDRKQAGMNVPADGLYLVAVKYPEKIFIQ